MMRAKSQQPVQGSEAVPEYDVLIVGAGISGLYQLYSVRKLGLSVHCLEAGSGVGGTWYWNRYPGARFDSESWSYGYSWSKEVLDEWHWTEHYSAQPETLRYLNFVADKYDLKRDITFSSRVRSAHFHEEDSTWTVEAETGLRLRCKFLVFAVGMLSAEMIPNIKGRETFQGGSWHTSQWPHDPNGYGGKDMGLAGKRVAVIGTGATGIQTIQELAKTVGELYVFQATPEYAAPILNSKIDAAAMEEIRSNYAESFARMKTTRVAFIHDSDPRNTLDVPDKEREEHWEKLYATPGFSKWLGGFADAFTDRKANELWSEFMRKKIRARIKDPKVADKLVPTSYGFGLRRVPLENGYYEAFNQDNVHLVDLASEPIEEINKTGIRTSDSQYEVDFIIFATGFDACTGMFKRMDIRGLDGRRLMDAWEDGPQTYLGLLVNGFPNMFTLVGPHNGATFCNIPRCIEQNVEWVTDFLAFCKKHHVARAQPRPAAQEAYTRQVYAEWDNSLMGSNDTWWNGTNVAGKKRRFLAYYGGMPVYRKLCADEATNQYSNFELTTGS